MNWSNVKLIMQREVRDQLRDRRTLFMIAVLPLVLYPLLGMSFFQIAQFTREQVTRVLLVGGGNFPGMPPLVESESKQTYFTSDLFTDPDKSHLVRVQLESEKSSAGGDAPVELRLERAMREGNFDVALQFPPDFAKRSQLAGDAAEGAGPIKPPQVVLLANTAKERSQIAAARVNDVLQNWSIKLSQRFLQERHLPATLVTPFVVDSRELAAPAQRQAILWSKVLPFVLLLWALTGAFYPAVDLCAGEKERGTLETLLISPAERIEIVWGKLLTIMLFSMATAILNLLSMGLTGSLVLSQLPNFGPPPPLAIAWLLMALVPVSALFSALCLALAAFARSTKEGQYYLMPLVLITMPLIILPMSPGVELSLGNSLIPITGIVLLLRTVLEGNYVEALAYFPLVAAVTLACCLWAVRWATEQFNTESVLFRESERLDLGLWLRHLMRDREDTPTAAEAVFCGVLILLIRFFLGFAIPAPRDFDGFTRIAVITQLVVIATPALLMAVMLTRSPAKTLLLRWPAWQVLPAVLLLAAATHPVATSLQALVRWIYPMSEDVKRELAKLMGQAPQHQFWFLLLVIAVIPAICEELAFRGFVLSGLRHLGRKWRAIAISSLFFGVTHAIFQQSLVACLVGAVIGYVAVQTESIFPAMLFHASHNALALLSSQIDSDMLDRHPAFRWAVSSTAADGTMYHWSVVLGAAILMAALLVWFSKLPYAKSSEESLQEAIDHSSSRDLEGALFKTPPLRSESSV